LEAQALTDEVEQTASERSQENTCYVLYFLIQITATWTRKTRHK